MYKFFYFGKYFIKHNIQVEMKPSFQMSKNEVKYLFNDFRCLKAIFTRVGSPGSV